MANKKISYTTRDFQSIRTELINFTKTYYPDTIQNFNDASVFSVLLDLNAAVTDNLQFNIDTTINSLSASSRRIGVRMMVVSPKGYAGREPAYNAATTWLAHLLKKGNTTTGFTGLVIDFYSSINTDVITCHYDKKFYVKSPYLITAVGDANTSGSTKFFKIRLPCKRVLKYDASVDSGLTPTSFNPFLILGYCHLDNATPDTLQTQINLNYICEFKYQDA